MQIRTIFALSSIITMILLASPKQVHADGHPDKLRILSLLETRDFKTLNQLLETIQELSEKDINREIDVTLAFNAFSTSRPDFEPLLDEWVKKHPESYAAHLANGSYFQHRAWLKRGSKWSKDTTSEQLRQMNLYFAESIRYVTGALTLRPTLIEGYAILINAAMAMSKPEHEQQLVRQALEKSPASFRIRRSHMQALLPRWGGSYEAMRNFARESQAYSEQNPNLKVLRGLVMWDKGRNAMLGADYGNAVQFFTQAIQNGESPEFYADRADAYMRIKDYGKALVDTHKALELYPQNPSVLADQAGALAKLGRIGEAISDLELVTRIDPGETSVENIRDWLSDLLIRQGYELQRDGKYDEAILQFNSAEKLNPARYQAFYWRARVYAHKGRFDLAEADLNQAIRLNPRYFEAYQTLDWILARDRRWDEVVSHWNRFIQIEPGNANAYIERAGTFRHKGNMVAALEDLKKACDLGNSNACQIHNREASRIGAIK